MEELEAINKKLLIQTKIDAKEVQFMGSARVRLDKNWGFLGGILAQYYNLFGKRVSEEYFKKRMSEVLNQKSSK